MVIYIQGTMKERTNIFHSNKGSFHTIYEHSKKLLHVGGVSLFNQPIYALI